MTANAHEAQVMPSRASTVSRASPARACSRSGPNPSLGGRDTLRGYIGNRWTGKAAWHGSGEYRFWFLPRGIAFTDSIRLERLGGALFYEMGSVAGSVGGLTRATVRDSWGVSLRVGFERSTLFRLDLGFSGEGYAFTLAHGLSF